VVPVLAPLARHPRGIMAGDDVVAKDSEVFMKQVLAGL
jgi:hypothetical protein